MITNRTTSEEEKARFFTTKDKEGKDGKQKIDFIPMTAKNEDEKTLRDDDDEKRQNS